MMDMNPESIKKTLMYGPDRFQKGQMILYEGKEAKIISVKPMFVIKVEHRVICGALRNRIKFIARHEKHSWQDGH